MRFDDCAQTYDEHAGPQRFFARRVATFVNPTPAESVLELGAGTGALTRELIQLRDANAGPEDEPAGLGAGGPVLATDASSTMVEQGRTAVPRAHWAVLDAFNDPLPPALLQVSSGLLHWAENPESTLARWKSFLAPGGRMVHGIPCEPCLAEWRAIVPESPVHWHSEEEWLRILKRAGLHVTRAQRWTHSARCASALEMVRGFHRTGVTGRVRIGMVRLRQAMHKYEARHRSDGGILATWSWLAVEAVAS
jgi:SAM-dependent methyltransferase